MTQVPSLESRRRQCGASSVERLLRAATRAAGACPVVQSATQDSPFAWAARGFSHCRRCVVVGNRIARIHLCRAHDHAGLLTRARESSRAVSCRSNMKQVGLALGMYESDHIRNGRQAMPPDIGRLCRRDTQGPRRPGRPCVSECRLWRGGDPERPEAATGNDYVYARLIDPDKAPQDAPIMWDKYKHTMRRFWHWRGKLLRAAMH